MREQAGQSRGLIRSAWVLIVLVATFVPIALGMTSQVVAATTDHVVINEIFPSPAGSDKEWVELYNPTIEPVSLTGWQIKDGSSYVKNLTGTIAPGGFVTFDVDNFNNSGDTAILMHSGSKIDERAYGSIATGKSFGRIYDGADTWVTITSPTRNASNGIAPDLTPPAITDMRLTNVVLWGADYNILTQPNHQSDVTGRPTIGGTVQIGAHFSDDRSLTTIGAEVLTIGTFGDNEFTPAVANNGTLVEAGRHEVAWDTKNGADWRSVPDGNYTFKFSTKDGASPLKNSSSESLDLTIDNTAPSVEFKDNASPSENEVVSGTIGVTGNFDDANGLKEVSIEIDEVGKQQICQANWPDQKKLDCQIDTTTFSDGIHSLKVSAQDKAGNTSHQLRSIVVNNHAPGVPQLVSPGSGSTVNAAGATVDWTSESDGNGAVTYSFKLAHNADMSSLVTEQSALIDSGINIASFGHGAYYWQVQACDGLGSCSIWSDIGSLNIDAMGPALTITSVERNSDGTYTVRGTTDSDDQIHLFLDDETIKLATILPIAGMWSYTTTGSLILGDHTFFASSSDGVGNESRINNVFTVSAAPLIPSFGITPTPLPLITSLARAATGVAIGIGPGSVRIDDRASTSEGVLGDSSSNSGGKPAAVEATTAGWQLYGLAWYWWLALIGGVGAGGWALALRLRRLGVTPGA